MRTNPTAKIKQQIQDLAAGDLVRVEWFDASIGRSLTSGTEVISLSGAGGYS